MTNQDVLTKEYKIKKIKILEIRLAVMKKMNNTYYPGTLLIVLAFFVYSQQGIAMENDTYEKEHLISKKDCTIKVITQEEGEPLPLNPFLTLKDIKDLIAAAKKNKVEAQDKLINHYSEVPFWNRGSLAPKKIGFLDWKTQDLDKTIQDRCASNDSYAYYALSFFREIEEKFPDLAAQIQERAKQGNCSAQLNLGLMHLGCYGIVKGVEHSVKEAYQVFKSLADQGNAMAQFHLGYMCGVYKENLNRWNYLEVVHYFELAADQGHVQAQLELGGMYILESLVVEKEPQKAIQIFESLTERGHSSAQGILSRVYKEGRGVDKDLEKAAHYSKLACDQEDTLALKQLAVDYEYGQNVEKNPIEATYWYIKSKSRCHLKGNLCIDLHAPTDGASFQDMLNAIISGKNATLDETLNSLLSSHQIKMVLNKENSWSKSVFPISDTI